MNIFVLYLNPMHAAQAHYDKHVVKMCLEYAQILSTVSGKGYKPTHKNHPCVKWAAAAPEHYSWLYHLAIELGREYTARYGRVHASTLKLLELPEPLPLSTPTWFALAMPDEYKSDDPVESYRQYYRTAKRELASYRAPAITPSWLN